MDDEGHHGGISPERALPPSKPVKSWLPRTTTFRPGRPAQGGFQRPKTVRLPPRSPAHTTVSPGATVSRQRSRSVQVIVRMVGNGRFRVPADPLVVEVQVGPDPQAGSVGRHRQLPGAPLHGLSGHQGEVPQVLLLGSGLHHAVELQGVRTVELNRGHRRGCSGARPTGGLKSQRSTGARRGQDGAALGGNGAR